METALVCVFLCPLLAYLLLAEVFLVVGATTALIDMRRQGITNSFLEWGNVLKTYYSKPQPSYDVNAMIQYLGYSTTGFYFYDPIVGNYSTGDYESTLLQVHFSLPRAREPA